MIKRHAATPRAVPFETFYSLAARHRAVVFDLEGTLMRGGQPAEGAIAAIDLLDQSGIPWVIATNDASRAPADIAHGLVAAGFGRVEESAIFTSGSLIGPFLARHGVLSRAGRTRSRWAHKSDEWPSPRCLVLGPEQSHLMVTRGGGTPVVPADADNTCAVIVLADESGYDLSEGLEVALGIITTRASMRLVTHLVLPNNDVVIPNTDSQGRPWTLGAGALCRMLKDAAARVCGRRFLAVHVLGKPRPALLRAAFEGLCRACDTLTTSQVLMVGDRLETDIAGAHTLGFTAALLAVDVMARPCHGHVWPDVVTTLATDTA